MSKLILIDGMAIIHRAYHALPPMTTRDGQPVNAVYGFTSMLLRIVDELKPNYLIVAFDLPQPTFRRELYIAYQATRPHVEDGLSSQFNLVREVVEAADIPLLAVPGFEADDVIGTIANEATKSKKVDEVLIITGDRDMMQLVNKKVHLFMPVKGLSEGKIVDEAHVKNYWDVMPSQIIDLKGLIGDSSDNYPGVPGVGPKTAATLLADFGTLENIYKNIDSPKIKDSVRKKLVDGHESALLSQKLATIVTEVPVTLNLEEAKVTEFRTTEKFLKKIQSLNFKSLLSRIKTQTGVEKLPVEDDDGQMGLI